MNRSKFQLNCTAGQAEYLLRAIDALPEDTFDDGRMHSNGGLDAEVKKVNDSAVFTLFASQYLVSIPKSATKVEFYTDVPDLSAIDFCFQDISYRFIQKAPSSKE